MPEVRTVSTATDLEALVPPWRDALSRASSDAPTASPSWLGPACDAALREGALRIITMSDEGELVGVLPMHLAPQRHGPLRRNLMRPLHAGPDGGRRRGSMLVVGGYEQQFVRAVVALLDGELQGWDRLELSGMVTDGALPSLWLANARELGVAELSMAGHEQRRDLEAELPPRPSGWEEADDALRRADDAAAASPLLDMLDDGVRSAALAALDDGATLWGLYVGERRVAVALTLAGHGARYAVSTAVVNSAPPAAEEALHVMLMERARDDGATRYAAWCPVPSGLLDDQCAIRSLTVERRNALNTRNRLWNRLQAGVSGLRRR